MKTIAELNALRDEMQSQMGIRHDKEAHGRIVVAMGTCGIAAGAREVVGAFADALDENKLYDIALIQAGCMGICQYEPVAEVFLPNQEKVTYVRLTPDKARRIVAEHLAGGTPVAEYTISAAK